MTAKTFPLPSTSLLLLEWVDAFRDLHLILRLARVVRELLPPVIGDFRATGNPNVRLLRHILEEPDSINT